TLLARSVSHASREQSMSTLGRFITTVGLLLIGLAAGVAARPNAAGAATTTYDLRLQGWQESPAVSDPANGWAQLSFDDATRTLTWWLTIGGVSPDVITGAHIHRGGWGVNGPVL